MLGDVKVDKHDPTDLYEQVAAEIRRAIADGEAKPGERLPPAKDLAAILGVNTNTVLRSLRVLRDEGLLEFRRGRGISVAGDARTWCRRPAREGARRLRPQPGLPPRRADRDHRRHRLTTTAAPTRRTCNYRVALMPDCSSSDTTPCRKAPRLLSLLDVAGAAQERTRSSAARSVGSPCAGSTSSTGRSSSGRSRWTTSSRVTCLR